MNRHLTASPQGRALQPGPPSRRVEAIGSGRSPQDVRRARARPGEACRPEWRSVVVGVLNYALATEIADVKRYLQHHYEAGRRDASTAVREVLVHAAGDVSRVECLARRIQALGGTAELHSASTGDDAAIGADGAHGWRDLIRIDLEAERAAVERYRRMIAFVDDKDPATRWLFEQLLEDKSQHSDELSELLPR